MSQTSKAYMGQIIRELRSGRDMKAEDLANLLGKSSGTITAWERGETEPASENIMRMCEIFDVEPAVFFRSRKAPSLTSFEASKINALNDCYIRMNETQRSAVLGVARAMVEC